jgi:hypothetical protein
MVLDCKSLEVRIILSVHRRSFLENDSSATPLVEQKHQASIDALMYKFVSAGQGIDGLVRLLLTELLGALTSMPPAGGGLSRLTYWKVPKG